jgi:hypothetical protein
MEFRGCYLHPTRPAVRDCINCERPICKLCEEESGDILLCLPCKQELEKAESSVRVPFKKEDLGVSERRTKGFDIADVTIMKDGSVVTPEVDPEPEAEEPAPAEPEKIPAVEKPIEKRSIKRAAPPRRPVQRKPSAEPAPVKARPTEVSEAPAVAAELPDEEEAEPERPAAPRRVPVKKKIEKKEKEFVPGGPLAQTVSGLPFAIGASLVLCALWALFALLARQWSHVAVFTLGIVVPWAWYKGTTVRKHKGKRVWEDPPAPLWVALPSFVLVAAIVIPLQIAAYELIYRSNPARLGFSDFYDRFFTTVGWLLLILGLVAAFAVPFLLKAGAEWRKPKLLGGEGDIAREGQDVKKG